jgi:hypothetical protein
MARKQVIVSGGAAATGTAATGGAAATSTAPAAATGAVDLKGFIRSLTAATDASRMSKATKMLQADRFQLFSEVSATQLTGVVKSQTDPDLVYACRLSSTGQFCCCTQNLFACGGLRGALCKHLLVLLVGLTQSGVLDPAAANAWAKASRNHKPKLDSEGMSATFIKYKGAQAGEIDWRPTETIPEDYYAY